MSALLVSSETFPCFIVLIKRASLTGSSFGCSTGVAGEEDGRLLDAIESAEGVTVKRGSLGLATSSFSSSSVS